MFNLSAARPKWRSSATTMKCLNKRSESFIYASFDLMAAYIDIGQGLAGAISVSLPIANSERLRNEPATFCQIRGHDPGRHNRGRLGIRSRHCSILSDQTHPDDCAVRPGWRYRYAGAHRCKRAQHAPGADRESTPLNYSH